MPTSTVTSKGQITIPLQVRRDLGLRPGSRVNFVRTEDGVYELVPATRSVTELKGLVTAPGGKVVSLAEMENAIAEGAAEESL
jgi:AbrB family looped-hinge helix DNA binding protein